MTPDECVDIGRKVAGRVCVRSSMWWDDVAAAATLAAWTHPDRPEGAAWCAAVDELRRLTHWRRPDRPANTVAAVVAIEGDGPPVEDTYDLGDVLDGATPVQRLVASAVAAGWQRQEVARLLGLAPCTVSYHMRELRRRLTM